MIKFTAQASAGGSIQWLVNDLAGGNAQLGTIDSSGNYTAPRVELSTNVVITAALAGSAQTDFATAVVAVINGGVLTPTPNAQVVAYSIYLPAPGHVSVQFGDAFMTSAEPTPSPNGGMVHVYVAGMRAHMTYPMHAIVALDNGISFPDTDHSFTAGSPPRTATVQVTSAGTPQPGIELFDTVTPPMPAQLFATDLQGNILWTYSYKGSSIDALQGARLLPNGHFLILISFASSISPQLLKNPPGAPST